MESCSRSEHAVGIRLVKRQDSRPVSAVTGFFTALRLLPFGHSGRAARVAQAPEEPEVRESFDVHGPAAHQAQREDEPEAVDDWEYAARTTAIQLGTSTSNRSVRAGGGRLMNRNLPP